MVGWHLFSIWDVKQSVKSAFEAANELDDEHIAEQPAQKILRRGVKVQLREARSILNEAVGIRQESE